MTSETTDKSNTIVTVTPIAHIKLLELRDAETEGAQLGLRLEILSQPGEDFRYTSGAILETALGTMQGSYDMLADDGTRFAAPIPAFTLSVPRTLH